MKEYQGWRAETMKQTIPRIKQNSKIEQALKSPLNTVFEVVDDTKLSDHPFSSVGRLYEVEGECYKASAFVAECNDEKKSIAFTAAYNLY